MLDPASLAMAVVSILGPLLAKSAEKAAETVGESAAS